LPRKLRVLVVDNEPSIPEVLRELFEPEHDVVMATSPGEAVSILDSDAFDVLVTDYNMPGMDGCVLSEIALEKCGAYCILLTGNDLSDVRGSVAVSTVYQKPLRWSKLAAEVRAVGARLA
jgi:CheY-like chemotaxis protein